MKASNIAMYVLLSTLTLTPAIACEPGELTRNDVIETALRLGSVPKSMTGDTMVGFKAAMEITEETKDVEEFLVIEYTDKEGVEELLVGIGKGCKVGSGSFSKAEFDNFLQRMNP